MLNQYLQRSMGFLGACADYQEAQAVLIGLPMDYTVSFKTRCSLWTSADSGNISIGLEMYSPYQDKSLADLAYYDAGDLELPFGNTLESLKRMEDVAREVFASRKFPLFLGGEHLFPYL